MSKQNNYFDERNLKTYERFEKIVEEDLPYFCIEFFNAIDTQTTYLTKLNYAMDLAIFFDFLIHKHKDFKGLLPIDIEIEQLNSIAATDIEYFLRYLSFYKYKGVQRKNSDRSKARKLSTIKSLFSHFYSRDKLKENVTTKVKSPKIRSKPIIRLEDNEVNQLLKNIESENALNSKFQNSYNKKLSFRDYTIITLILNTGIRISECVGLDIDDIDLSNNSFSVTRKGGNIAQLYYSNDIKDLLELYLEHRNNVIAKNREIDPKDANALFISLQGKRLGVRSIQNIVKKYAKTAAPLKNISPHKLRATFGTALYNATGDIYVVAEVLGHKDINTTKEYYAATSEKIKKDAVSSFSYEKNN
ncbi:MAG TPA: tyrosine-type recombinase/integrase [Clostridiales bacterium]|nr:tyrosine-type recombinase/integrase [Clostridiales bacterium]